MLVCQLLMIRLRSDILRPLERFLHLLGKFIDAHGLEVLSHERHQLLATHCSGACLRVSVLAMSAEVKLTTRNALRVLRPGAFRRYIIGSAISDTGTWMQVMTQGWVMATLTSSAFMLGLANFCAGVPMLALMMVGGSAADIFDKRKILLITQYVQIGIAISIGLLIWSGKVAIWQIFVF